MGFLSKLLKFLKKWWWLILILIIVCWFFFPVFFAAMGTFFSSVWAGIQAFAVAIGKFGLLKSLVVGFGLLAIIDPDAATDIVDNVAEVADHVVDAGLGVVGNALSSPMLWIAGGLLAYWFFFVRQPKEKPADPEAQAAGEEGVYDPQYGEYVNE